METGADTSNMHEIMVLFGRLKYDQKRTVRFATDSFSPSPLLLMLQRQQLFQILLRVPE